MLSECYYVLNTYCNMKGNVLVKYCRQVQYQDIIHQLREGFLEKTILEDLDLMGLLYEHLTLEKGV